jgi:hypothetical protein
LLVHKSMLAQENSTYAYENRFLWGSRFSSIRHLARCFIVWWGHIRWNMIWILTWGIMGTLGGPAVQVMCLADLFSYWTAVRPSTLYIHLESHTERADDLLYSLCFVNTSLYSEDRRLAPVVFFPQGFST